MIDCTPNPDMWSYLIDILTIMYMSMCDASFMGGIILPFEKG